MAFRLGIIGGGSMGQAIVRGAVEAGVLAPEAVLVAEIDPRRREGLADLGCASTGDAAAVVAADEIMLATKPQSFPEVARAIAPLAETRVVLSIMAGLSSGAIRAALGERARVIRIMPNTPCRVGAGMAAIALGEGAEAGDETLAVAIFEALGKTTIVQERLMHAVTALSGSGPAYVFLLAEAMEEAAARLGLDPDTAGLLVRQTIRGSGKLLSESTEGPAALRAAVTSPGGTTEAALSVLEGRELSGIIIDAVIAARDRGGELEQGSGVRGQGSGETESP